MKNGHLSFLDEKLIKTMVEGEESMLSLCDILAELSKGDIIESFCSLRPHQRHAFFAFLVQLAAIAMNKTYEAKLPQKASEWHSLVLNINSDPSIWHLICEEETKPALFQPPMPEKEIKKWSKLKTIDAPDEIDILITSKNHDVKRYALYDNLPEHWFFALLTLQTMGGYSGSRNYGVSRMNRGLGNRPCVTRIPSLSWGERFRRDVAVLLENRPSVVERYGFQRKGGLELLWLEEWIGTREEMIDLRDLDPFYIEICRRIRLQWAEDGRIVAKKGATAAQRVDAASACGMVGDPWTPNVINKKTGELEKSLTVSWPGFDFRVVSKLFFENGIEPSLAQMPHPLDGPAPKLYMSTLIRGQGETYGFHERSLPIPEEFFSIIDKKSSRWNKISKRAADWIEHTSYIIKNVLNPALALALQGAPNKIDIKDKRILIWTSAVDSHIDEIFFEYLWDNANKSDEEAYAIYIKKIIDLCHEAYIRAVWEMPLSTASRYRSMALGHNLFQGIARINYPEAYEDEKSDWQKVQDMEIKRMPYQDDIDEAVCKIGLQMKAKLRMRSLHKIRQAGLSWGTSSSLIEEIKENHLSHLINDKNERQWEAIIVGQAILGLLNERFKFVGYMMGVAQYPERRVLSMLEARGESLWQSTCYLARFLVEKGHGVSWTDIARIILDESDKQTRLGIASSFYYEIDRKRKEKASKKEEKEAKHGEGNGEKGTGRDKSSSVVHRASRPNELCGSAP